MAVMIAVIMLDSLSEKLLQLFMALTK